MNQRLLRSLPIFTALTLGLVCLGVTVTTLYVLAVSHWHGPFRDMWEIYPFLQNIIQHTWTWTDLWESYGFAHRLVIPRLLFIADYHFADASNHLLISVSILCQGGVCLLFAGILFTQHAISLWWRWSLLFVVVICQFSATLLFNLMHTFDVQWFLCCFFVTAAFYVLTLPQQGNGRMVFVSALLIMAACLCNFSAMAAWPVWLLLLHNRGTRPAYLAALLASVMIFVVIYAVGVRTAGLSEFSLVRIPQSVWYFLFQFPLLYLCNPLSDPDYLPLGGWAAILLLIPLLLLMRFFWHFVSEKAEHVDRFLLFFAALMLFGFGVAVMTGLGRGYDPGHVYASRYQNIVMLFWSAALPFLFIQTHNLALWRRPLWRMPGVLFFAGLLVCQWPSWNENLLLGRNVARAHLALMMGYVDDIPMISATVSRSMIYVPGYTLEKERLLHEQARKGIYAGGMARDWLEGVRLSQISRSCESVEWQLTPRVTPYTRFTGFSVSGKVQPYNYAMLVEPDGKVVALAEPEKVAKLDGWRKTPPLLLRGFSRVEEANNVRLVMVSSRDRCVK